MSEGELDIEKTRLDTLVASRKATPDDLSRLEKINKIRSRRPADSNPQRYE